MTISLFPKSCVLLILVSGCGSDGGWNPSYLELSTACHVMIEMGYRNCFGLSPYRWKSEFGICGSNIGGKSLFSLGSYVTEIKYLYQRNIWTVLGVIGVVEVGLKFEMISSQGPGVVLIGKTTLRKSM